MGKINAMSTFYVYRGGEGEIGSQIRRQSHDKVPRLLGCQKELPDASNKIDRLVGFDDDFGMCRRCNG